MTERALHLCSCVTQVINKILDFVSTSDKLDLLADFYETTLKALEEARIQCSTQRGPADAAHLSLLRTRRHVARLQRDGTTQPTPALSPRSPRPAQAKNERLWFKTNLKLCKLYLDSKEYGRMTKILRELHKSCQKEVL